MSYLAPQPPTSTGQYLSPSQQLHHHDINGNQTSLQHQQPYHLQHTQSVDQQRSTRDRGGEISSQQHQQQYLPQNLSRKASFLSSTIPTTATTTAVSSRPSGTLPYSSFPSVPVFSMPFSAANLSKPHEHSHYSPKTSPDHLNLSNRSTTNSLSSLDSTDQPVAMIVDKHTHSSSSSTSSSSSGISSGASYTSSTTSNERMKAGNCSNSLPPATATEGATVTEEDCAIDASVSRKRRWSAPDVCDDSDGSQGQADIPGQPPSAKIPQVTS